MRLRQYPVMRAVVEGGLHRLKALPQALAREMSLVGNRPGHYRALMSLVHHWPTWEAVREHYGDIDRPVVLLYGDHDWSPPEERAEAARSIPGEFVSAFPPLRTRGASPCEDPMATVPVAA